MVTGFVIRKNEYYDSVFLMRVAKNLSEESGILQSAVVMGTDENKKVLAGIGISSLQIDQATPNDLIVAVTAQDQADIDRLFTELDNRLLSFSGSIKQTSFHSLDEAAYANPEANLVVISVPGNYAAREARKALDHNKHVFLFSSNVPLEDEIELKQFAKTRGLLVMGPDCGTSIINGVSIGFANVVRRGPIGVVGAAGTGLQEFTSLVHQYGSGISHAIGTGTRDLSDAVGGITTLAGMEILDADPVTRVIAVVSKPAQPATLQQLMDHVQKISKPVIGCFLGLEHNSLNTIPNFTQAHSIDEAVKLALQRLLADQIMPRPEQPLVTELVRKEILSWHQNQRYLRGLFAGGTLCYQSQQILNEAGISVYSNSPIDHRFQLTSLDKSLEHTIIDMGDEEYTRGKPHPMIDATQRRKRIMVEAADEEVAILLLDFVLGYLASPDPVGDLIAEIREAKEIARRRGGHLTVVASVCGTEQDFQGLTRQKSLLEQAGVLVFASNAQAVEFCAKLLLAAQGGTHDQ